MDSTTKAVTSSSLIAIGSGPERQLPVVVARWFGHHLHRRPGVRPKDLSRGRAGRRVPRDCSENQPDPRFLLYPSYSADEQWIVFEADPFGLGGFGQRDIWVMKTESGEVQHIAKGQRPSWSADSRSIIYSSAEPGKNFSLWKAPFRAQKGKSQAPLSLSP
jgi:Tol biopolymer transport system component